MAPIALVLADPPRPGACLPRLEPLIGRDACAELQSVLIERASRWAESVSPGRALVSTDVLEGETEAARRARECAAAFDRFGADAPLLLAFAGLPRLRAVHAEDALADLAAGADVSFGPSNDGGYYLLALARPVPEIFDIAPETWDGPLVLPRTIELAAKLGLEGGLLRMERMLATPADARALVADPLTPSDIRRILERTTLIATESDSANR